MKNPFQSHLQATAKWFAKQKHMAKHIKHLSFIRKRIWRVQHTLIGQPFSLALSVVQGEQESSGKKWETAPCSIRDHLGDLQWASWEEGKRRHSTWYEQYCFAYTTSSLQNIINISKPNLNAQHHQPIRDISQWIANTDTSFSSADLEED